MPIWPAIDKETKEKASGLDRLHNDHMKLKLIDAKTPDRIQIMTLAPDSWSREYCSRFFNVSEYVVRVSRELKKKNGILAKPSPKKGKKISHEIVELVHLLYENVQSSNVGEKRLCFYCKRGSQTKAVNVK